MPLAFLDKPNILLNRSVKNGSDYMPYIYVPVNIPLDLFGTKTDYVPESDFVRLYPYMQRDNCLAVRLSIETGLRISDVLALRKSAVSGQKITFIASKTKKSGSVTIPASLAAELKNNAKNGLIFPGRDGRKPKTRQAVWRDVRNAAVSAGVRVDGLIVAPHSCRKIFAVKLYHDTGDIGAVRQALQHSRDDVTEIYAYSDVHRRGGDDVATVIMRMIPYIADVVSDLVVAKLKEEFSVGVREK